jgi:hypothetical protein
VTRAEICDLVLTVGRGIVTRVAVDSDQYGTVLVKVRGHEGLIYGDQLDKLERACRPHLPIGTRVEISSAGPSQAKHPTLCGGARGLRKLAALYPEEVLENPLLDIISLEDPAAWREIRETIDEAMGLEKAKSPAAR